MTVGNDKADIPKIFSRETFNEERVKPYRDDYRWIFYLMIKGNKHYLVKFYYVGNKTGLSPGWSDHKKRATVLDKVDVVTISDAIKECYWRNFYDEFVEEVHNG